MMLPDDDMFAEMVKSGQPIGRLSDQDLCELFSLRC